MRRSTCSTVGGGGWKSSAPSDSRARVPCWCSRIAPGTVFPYEAFMLARALGMVPGARAARPLLDDWLLALPVVGGALRALGAETSSAPTLRRVLASGDVAITFPETPAVVGKPMSHWYRLGTFGQGTHLRVALDAGAPIVPVARHRRRGSAAGPVADRTPGAPPRLARRPRHARGHSPADEVDDPRR